jgi:uncharacterized protein (DUF433 family)
LPQLLPIKDDALYEPTYTIGQVAGVTGIHHVTVRRWLLGYDYGGRHMDPVFSHHIQEIEGEFPLLVSFVQFSELVIAQRFRQGTAAMEIPGQNKVAMRLKRIRAAHKYARERMGIPYPFASLKLHDFGGHIMHQFEESTSGPQGYLALDLGGHWVLPTLVEKAIGDFKYQEDGVATEWFPLGDDQPVRMNPRIRGGQPTVIETGVTVMTVAGRINRGENPEIVAYDYGISSAAIDAAVRTSKLFAA